MACPVTKLVTNPVTNVVVTVRAEPKKTQYKTEKEKVSLS